MHTSSISRRGLLFAGAAALAACTHAPVSAPAEPATRDAAAVVAAREDRPVQLSIGQQLSVALPSNASTGYAWELVEDGSPVLQRAPVPALPAPATPPLPGAAGVSRWRFEAVQAGSVELHLVYRRPWEKGAAPAQQVRYRVVVR